jgi:heme/copper-type cytochrome/quinol oxidase subunit 2
MSEGAADLMFWIALACCAVAQIAIIRSVLSVTPASVSAARAPVSRRATELAWAVLPALVLAALFWATWRAMHTHVLTGPGGLMNFS